MEQPEIIINTAMSKEDYRKFLYIATFRRNKVVIPFLGLISLIGSIAVSLDGGSLNFTKLIICWVLLSALAIIIVILRVEIRNSQRVKSDKTGTFNSINTLKFFDDRIVIENKEFKSTGELKYNQFFALMESKDYFIFYLTVNQASLVRKRDVDNINVFREFIVEKFGSKYRRI